MAKEQREAETSIYRVDTSTYGPVELPAYNDRNDPAPALVGAVMNGAEGEFGSMVCQQYVGEGFFIYLNRFRLKRKSIIRLPIAQTPLQSVSCLAGSGQQRPGDQKISMLKGRYCLLRPTGSFQQLYVEKGREYETLSLSYSPELLEPLLPFFPELEQLKENKSPAFLHRGLWMDSNLQHLVSQILNCPYEPALRDFLFRERAGDMLCAMLLGAGREPVRLKNLSYSDVEKIHYAHKLILEDVKSHYNISELSRKVELNEFKVKEGFRRVFGKGPFALLKDARMKVAHDLLITTNRPEKDIMTEAGYTSLTAFVKAFRTVYGFPPSHLRTRFDEEK